MQITGAVLEELGRQGPYAETLPITLSQLELDEPGAGEILVRIEVAGVCHSDLSVVNGSRPRPVPMLLGHEAAGIVEKLGEGVTDLRVGQRVVITFIPRCGSCEACAKDGLAPCINGSASNTAGSLLSGGMRLHRQGQDVFHHLGASGFADHAVVDRRSVVPVDEDVPARIAAVLGCAVLTGGGAVINAGRLKAGETIVVIGLGGVGMAALLTALAHDGIHAIAVDARQDKLDLALTLGAEQAFLPQDLVTSGVHADLVVEAVGKSVAFESGLNVLAPGGRLVTVGLPAPDDLATVSPLTLVARGQSIIGSYLGSSIAERDIPIFVEMWRSGRLPLEQLVSAEIHLSDINRAMDDLGSGSAIRQLIIFDGKL